MTVYPHYIRNHSQWNAMWWDNQPHGYRSPILFPHSAKQCMTAGKTTMTASKIYHGCFEMLPWPHHTSANIINICFWLLETCTKCSYFIEKTYDLALNGWHLKWRYRKPATNIPCGGVLLSGKFPDNRRSMCLFASALIVLLINDTITLFNILTCRSNNHWLFFGQSS